MIRDFITDHIDTHVNHGTVGLLLSGGVDSISVGISAQDAGRKVHAYSFTLDSHESYDFVKAREVADTMGWEFTPVIIPTANIKQDFQRLVDMGCRKKSEFEAAAYPFLYVYDAMVEKYSVTGWVAAASVGSSRKVTQTYVSFKKKRNYVKWCKESGDKRVNWNQFREAYLDGHCAGIATHNKVAEMHGKVHVAPWGDQRVRDYLMQFSWQELNTPQQKNIIRTEYDIENLFGKIKPHINLQLGSQIDKLFETLLLDNDINWKRRNRVMDLCRDHHQQNLVSDLSEFIT